MRTPSQTVSESVLLVELATIHLLQGPTQYANAMRSFREASRKDPENVTALLGMIRCQLLEGALEDAEGQIELLTVMHNADELGAEFAFLQAIMARLGAKDMKKHLKLLDDCKQLFDNNALRASASALLVLHNDAPMQNFITMSPDFNMSMAIEYLAHMESALPTSVLTSGLTSGLNGESEEEVVNSAPVYNTGGTLAMTRSVLATGTSTSISYTSSTPSAGSAALSFSSESVDISPPVQTGMSILKKTLNQYPGFVCAYVESARCFNTLGMGDEAVRCLLQCLSMQPTCTAALIAMAKVEASRSNTAAADRALEQALSCDFSIRSVPLFRLVRGTVLFQQARYDEAITDLEQLAKSPEIRQSDHRQHDDESDRIADSLGPSFSSGNASSSNPVPTSNSYADSFRLSDDDRVGVFVTLSALYGKVKRTKEASKILSEAKIMFAGTSQEVLVLVAASQRAVEKNDYDSAVRMLDKISEESPTYTRAQLIKAEILLNHNRDQEGYTNCFQLLGEHFPEIFVLSA